MSMDGDVTFEQFMNLEGSQDIDRILGKFGRFGVNLGLERILQLLADLGDPHKDVPVIHVAGTNGKGSVCAYLSNVLTQAGYRVGRYTSPHLISWCERICINGQPIAVDTLRSLLRHIESVIRPEPATPTQFEVFTAAAWLYFAQRQVDVAVMEVGLGGRLDATNVCDRPLVTIITSISRDHWQRLGPTLADIAREKAGILKPDRPAIIGPLPLEAETVFQERIAALHCPDFWPQPAQVLENGWAEYSPISKAQGFSPPASIQYPLNLSGQHQLTNSAVAIAALYQLQQQGWRIPQDAIIQGLATTKWPGRLQWTYWRDGQGFVYKLLIDGAHNAAAAEALRHYVESLEPLKNEGQGEQGRQGEQGEVALGRGIGEIGRMGKMGGAKSKIQNPKSKISVSWLMGMLSTKDHAAIFKALLRPGDRLHLVPVPGHLSAELEELGAIAQSICPNLAVCQTHADLALGLTAAMKDDQTEESQLTVLCGSLYLVGHFLDKFRSAISPHLPPTQ